MVQVRKGNFHHEQEQCFPSHLPFNIVSNHSAQIVPETLISTSTSLFQPSGLPVLPLGFCLFIVLESFIMLNISRCLISQDFLAYVAKTNRMLTTLATTFLKKSRTDPQENSGMIIWNHHILASIDMSNMIIL